MTCGKNTGQIVWFDQKKGFGFVRVVDEGEENKEVFFKGIEKRNKKIKNLLIDYEKLQAEEKESHKRIGELFPYEQQHFELIDAVNKERQRVFDRDNLINQLIEKVSELGENPEQFRKKFLELKNDTKPA